MNQRSRVLTALLVLSVSACRDTPVEPTVVPGREEPTVAEPPNTLRLLAMECSASLQSLEVTCGLPKTPSGISGDIIVGGQNLYVTMASTNVAYNSGTGQFTFDATIRNLIPQPMGTVDGTNPVPSGIRVFFADGPTVTSGTGTASVVPNGFDSFTAAGQPYYQYNEVLEQGEVSAAKTWTLIMPPTVLTFSFRVFVSAPVQWPDGYITLDDRLPGASYGDMHPTAPHVLTAVIRNAVGNTMPGPVTWGTTDPQCATVNPTGEVSGVRAGTCSITASGNLNGNPVTGAMSFAVTGMTRIWNGSVSTDFEAGANWDLGVTPAAADSISVPESVPNYPALTTSRSIAGITVGETAHLSLGAFTLTASGNLQTGWGFGSGVMATTGRLILAGTNRTVTGRVPSVLVTGPYSLVGDLYVIAPLEVDLAELSNGSYLIEVISQ